LLKIISENENIFKYSLLTNNILGIILYNLKDSNNITNVVINVTILNVIYIFPNTVQTKNITIKKTNITTIEKNIITINQRVKIKRKSIRNLIKYISFNSTTIITTNKQIVLLFPPFLHPDLIA